MVEDLGYGGSQLGIYAGGLAASFCGAQFCSSIMWGILSDKYGRKPTIFIGTLGAVVGMITFGCATTYSQAIIGRIISGFLSGNLGVLKSFLTEITDDTNRAAGFSYMSVAWALGCIIAPLAGGLLCNPADKFPKYFDHSGIFGIYPYFLPCFICVLFNLTSALTCLAFMQETRRPNQIMIAAAQVTESPGIEMKSASATVKLPVVKDSDTPNSGNLLTRALGKAKSGLQSQRKHEYNVLPPERSMADLESGVDENGAEDTSGSEDDWKATVSPLSDSSDVTGGASTTSDIKDIEKMLSAVGDEEHGFGDIGVTSQYSSKSDFEIDGLMDDDEGDDESVDEDDEMCECCCLTATSSSNGRNKGDRGVGGKRSKGMPYKSLKDSSSHGFTIETLDDDFEDTDDVTTVESSQASSSDTQEYNERGVKGMNGGVGMGGRKGSKAERAKEREERNRKNVLKMRSVVLVTCNYGMLAMAFILWDETIPLFLKLDQAKGGFGLDSSSIGLLLSSSGGVMLVFTFIVLPRVAKRSKKLLFRIGMYGALPVCFAIPILATLKWEYQSAFQTKEGSTMLWMLLVSCCVLKNVCACIAFTA